MKPRVPALLFLALNSTPSLTAEALAAAPRYRMVLDSSQAEQGVKTVSFVKKPAIERGWVALSAVEPTAPTAQHFHFSEVGQRQVLTGPALIPGQQILRLDAEGNPFYITFDEENIAATQRQFAAQLRHLSTNEDHATALEGNVVEENWIIADPTCDKALALGLSDLPAGTWMLSIHVPDTDYWQREIVSGNKLGFSIEGLFTTEQLTLSAATPTKLSSVMNWFQRITAKLSKEKAQEVAIALGVVELADGRAVNVDEATGAVTLVGEDGQPGEALPDGEYDLKDGGKLVVKDGLKAAAEVDAAKAAGTDGAATDEQPAAEAAPAPLADNAGLPEVVAAINQLIKANGGKEQPKTDLATEPAAPKLAAALHNVALADLGAKLTELKLDAIELDGDDKLTYNAVTRRLSDSSGALVESGFYAAADGSYFQVSTSQYIWEIDKQNYDAVYGAKLQSVELAKLKATMPAAGRLKLNSEHTEHAATAPIVKLGLSATARLREMQEAGE